MNIKPLTLVQRIRVHGVNASADDWATLESKLLELQKYQAEAAFYGCRTPDELRQKLLQRTSEVAILATTEPTINSALSTEIDTLQDELKEARKALDHLVEANTDLSNALVREVELNTTLLAQVRSFENPSRLESDLNQRLVTHHCEDHRSAV
jgi:predicted  nucleic acid-binding Zn-ribbon protein